MHWLARPQHCSCVFSVCGGRQVTWPSVRRVCCFTSCRSRLLSSFMMFYPLYNVAQRRGEAKTLLIGLSCGPAHLMGSYDGLSTHSLPPFLPPSLPPNPFPPLVFIPANWTLTVSLWIRWTWWELIRRSECSGYTMRSHGSKWLDESDWGGGAGGSPWVFGEWWG